IPAAVEDDSDAWRVNLTRPPDKENELIAVAASHGAPGITARQAARLRTTGGSWCWLFGRSRCAFSRASPQTTPR
ncbi:unnamed protein product, partial [Prorocentrum cordatum]